MPQTMRRNKKSIFVNKFYTLQNTNFVCNPIKVWQAKYKALTGHIGTACRTYRVHIWLRRNGLLQCVSRIWASLTWLKFVIHWLEMISDYCPSYLKH